MIQEEAYKIAQPLLKDGVVCVLSDGSAFLSLGESDMASITAFAESKKLKMFVFNKPKVELPKEEVKPEAVEVPKEKKSKKKA
jgi:hypothetical protein